MKKIICFAAVIFYFSIQARAGTFQDLSAEDQKKAIENYNSYQKLSPLKQQMLQKNFEHWQSLSPEKQQAIEGRYRAIKKLSMERQEWAMNRGNSRGKQLASKRGRGGSHRKHKTAKT